MSSQLEISRIFIGVECLEHNNHCLIGYNTDKRNPDNIYDIENVMRICDCSITHCRCVIKKVLVGHKYDFYLLVDNDKWDHTISETKSLKPVEQRILSNSSSATFPLVKYSNGGYFICCL